MNYGEEYHDRGMVKWGGFYLSEHTETIDGERKQERDVPRQKFQMDIDEIAQIMSEARIKNKTVAIQIELRDSDGNYPPDTIGHIIGYDDLGIYVGNSKVNYDEIRNIEIVNELKWSDTKNIL